MNRYLIFLIVSLSLRVLGQNSPSILSDSDEYKELSKAKARLKVSITTNKPVYIPGEEIEITVVVANPTRETLRVRDPFSPKSGRFWIMDSASLTRFQPEERSRFSVPVDSLTTFAPGEERQRTFGFDRSFLSVAAPHEPGIHKLLFTYNGTQTTIEVLDADLEKAFEFLVPSSRAEREAKRNSAVPKDRYQRVISVRSGEESRICLTVGQSDSLQHNRFGERLRGEKKLSKLGSFFGLLRCIGVSNSPTASLEATFSNDGTMLLISTADDNSTRKFYVNQQNKVIH